MRRLPVEDEGLSLPGFNLRREAAPHATRRKAIAHFWNECFNLRREAAPHATYQQRRDLSHRCGFNLRREAAPHATRSSHTYAPPFNSFQSQTRSRSTCDFLLRITSLLS